MICLAQKIKLKRKGGDNMISIYEKSNVRTKQGVEEKEIEFRGLSTDEKPTTIGEEPIANGTSFIEIDTGTVFLYDSESQEWNEV